MDTTETYIKMCRCPEIQGVRPRDSDGCLPAKYLAGYCPDVDKLVWTPRQDELQEMVDVRTADAYFDWSKEFVEFDEGYIARWMHDYARKMETPEQLWLAFVMKEKHGKVWDGEKWAAE